MYLSTSTKKSASYNSKTKVHFVGFVRFGVTSSSPVVHALTPPSDISLIRRIARKRAALAPYYRVTFHASRFSLAKGDAGNFSDGKTEVQDTNLSGLRQIPDRMCRHLSFSGKCTKINVK